MYGFGVSLALLYFDDTLKKLEEFLVNQTKGSCWVGVGGMSTGWAYV
jgi:hypothetical protein